MKNFVSLLLTLSVFFGAVSFLCPSGSIGKAVRSVFALLFTVSVITFITNSPLPNRLFKTPESTDISAYSLRIIEAETVSELSEVLDKNGIPYREIKVSASISDSGVIFIDNVTVFSSADPEKIKQLFDCEVKNSG